MPRLKRPRLLLSIFLLSASTAFAASTDTKKPGYLGIVFEVEPGGLTIMGVRENTPAAKQGLRKGDVMLRFDDVDVAAMASTEEFRDYFRYLREGDRVAVTILRQDEEMTLELILGAQPGRVHLDHRHKDERSVQIDGFQRWHGIGRRVQAGKNPIGLRNESDVTWLAAPAAGIARRKMTFSERYMLDHMRNEHHERTGSDALRAAEGRPGTCVRLWLQTSRGGGPRIVRWTATPDTSPTNCP